MYTLVVRKIEGSIYQPMWLGCEHFDEGILTSMNDLVRSSLFRYRQVTLPEPIDADMILSPINPMSYEKLKNLIDPYLLLRSTNLSQYVYLWVDEHGWLVKDLEETDWLDKSGWKKVE